MIYVKISNYASRVGNDHGLNKVFIIKKIFDENEIQNTFWSRNQMSFENFVFLKTLQKTYQLQLSAFKY